MEINSPHDGRCASNGNNAAACHGKLEESRNEAIGRQLKIGGEGGRGRNFEIFLRSRYIYAC